MIARDAWARVRRDRWAAVCLTVIGVYALIAIMVALGLIGADHDARVGAKYLGPGAGHWLGTDRQGRDIAVRAVYAAKVALSVGLISATAAVLLGTILGALAGWFRGAVDAAIVWLYSTVQSIPSLLLLMALTYVAGKGLGGVYVAFIGTFWVGTCRVIRGEVMKLSSAEFVEAARALGYGDFKILLRHVLPNTFHLVLINFTLVFVGAIKSEVILSYLGLGVQGEPSWGTMIDQARAELINGFFWQIGAASVAMFVLVLAFSVLANVLQDALDPKSARGEVT